MSNKKYSKEYYIQNREAIIERSKLNYQKNKIKYLDYMREYNKKYYLEHKTNWNVRRNNKSLEEKQKNNRLKKPDLKEISIPYKKPNFWLII